MSFASEVKNELCRVPVSRHCCAVAEAYGVLLYCHTFTTREIRIVTACDAFAERLPKLFRRAFGAHFSLPAGEKAGGRHVLTITDRAAVETVFAAFGADLSRTVAHHINLAVLENDCCKASFLRGAFLAGGSVTAPSKNYHLELITAHASVSRETAALREAAEQGRRDEEWLRFQTEELTAANLRAGEQAEIEEELAMLENADRIGEAFTTLRNALDADETGVLVQLKNSETSLAHIGEHYPAAAEYAARLRSTLEELKDIGASAAADSERIDADPERLAKLSARLDTLIALQQKHHAADEAELIGLRDRCTARLAAIVHGDERIAEAEAALQKAAEKARKLADRLRKAREKAAPAFAGHIRGTLARLGMPDTVFEAAIDDLGELTRTGGDSVRFLFSANRGRASQSVERIASGGELSRVMLALKALLAERMQLPTIIFDEIDTGVSGRIADAMGEIIASLAASMQVVDITHLPQVASKGAAHFVVYKRDGRTSITRLSDDERITEIAKMLSGSEITDAAIAQARILLGRNGEPHPAAPGCSDTPAPGSLF